MLRNPRFWEPAFDDLIAVAGALRRCGRCRAAGSGRSLHGFLVKEGLSGSTFLANSGIAMYADLGLFGDAQAMFDEMPKKNVASWTASMAAHCAAGQPHQALSTFSLMLASASEDLPNGYTFSAALKACGMSGDLRLGRQIHGQIVGARLVSDTVLMNSLLDFYLQCGNLHEARKAFAVIPSPTTSSWNIMLNAYFNGDRSEEEAAAVFFGIPNPDAVSFNTVIGGLAKKESPKALEFLRLMLSHGRQADAFTFPGALKVCGSLGFAAMGRQIHGCLVKSGLRSSHCGSSLIQMYSSCIGIAEAEKTFEEYADPRGPARDLLAVSNAMVSGFLTCRLCRPALRLVSWLHGRGFVPDAYTLSAAARACTQSQDRRSGLQVHGMVAVNGLLSDPATGTLLVEMYARFGDLFQAMAVFDLLPRKDAIAWGALIARCVELGSNQSGFSLFKKMMMNVENAESAAPDEFVLSAVLRSRAGAADLTGGRQVHACTIKLGFSGEDATATSLVDMYSKCGEVEDGLAVFRFSLCRDTAAWTAIIAGCAINGRPREALGFLREMKKLGVDANEATITGTLSACRHGGLVEEACEIFRSTEKAPSPEHIHLMVDILSRAGRIGDARDLLDEVRQKGDHNTWNALIGGASTEGEIRALIGSHVVPVPTSAHVTLSNALAKFGRWDDSALVREAARGRRLRKEPGVSWVEAKA